MAEKTFIDAVEEKYADCDVATSDSMFVLKNMDVAGSDGKVHVPREMSLHRLGVTCAGDTTRIREICCQVTSLDVTNNLLKDWKEILTILACMPRVNFLNLSENILTEPLSDIGEQTFPNVTQLALNSTSIPLETVESLLRIMPNVSELHLCMNAYTSLTHQHQHPRVTTLYLNGNNLSDFGEILKLSPVYPNLRQLLLLQNPLTTLPAAEQIQSTFSKLECMNITDTAIDSWSELEKLRHFPALTDIRMKNLPLFKGMEEKLRRQFIVSYLPALTKLNMSVVSEEERTTAERRFVRHFVDKDDKPARCINITETGIDSWSELEKLRHFPALTDIRMKNLPLFKGMEEKLRRQFIVSYLPALTRLNMSVVGEEERTTAERRFVRHFVDKDNKPARFAELEAKHGTLDPLVEVDFTVPKHFTVQVHVGDKVVMKSIKLDQTVGELKKTLAKEVAGEPSTKFRFFHHKPQGYEGACDLRSRLNSPLHMLKVEDGDIFFLDLK